MSGGEIPAQVLAADHVSNTVRLRQGRQSPRGNYERRALVKPPAESQLWLQTHLGCGAACKWLGTPGCHPPDKRRLPLTPASPSAPVPRASKSAMTQGRGQAARGPTPPPRCPHTLPCLLPRVGTPGHRQQEPAGGLQNGPLQPFSAPSHIAPFNRQRTEPKALPLGVPLSHPHTRPWEKLVSSSHVCQAQQHFPLLTQAKGATPPAPPALTTQPQKKCYWTGDSGLKALERVSFRPPGWRGSRLWDKRSAGAARAGAAAGSGLKGAGTVPGAGTGAKVMPVRGCGCRHGVGVRHPVPGGAVPGRRRAGRTPAAGARVPVPYPARCPPQGLRVPAPAPLQPGCRARCQVPPPPPHPGAGAAVPVAVPVLTRRGRCRCCRTPCGCRPGSSPPPRCAAGRWAA